VSHPLNDNVPSWSGQREPSALLHLLEDLSGRSPTRHRRQIPLEVAHVNATRRSRVFFFRTRPGHRRSPCCLHERPRFQAPCRALGWRLIGDAAIDDHSCCGPVELHAHLACRGLELPTFPLGPCTYHDACPSRRFFYARGGQEPFYCQLRDMVVLTASINKLRNHSPPPRSFCRGFAVAEHAGGWCLMIGIPPCPPSTGLLMSWLCCKRDGRAC